VKAQLEKTFELEMLHDDRVSIEVMPHVAIVVAIGENMEGTPGISGRTFGSLGTARDQHHCHRARFVRIEHFLCRKGFRRQGGGKEPFTRSSSFDRCGIDR
jgi:aspartokinase